MFGPILAAYTILSFDCTHILVLELGGCCNESQGANLPEDEVRREVNRAFKEKSGMEREKGTHSTAYWVVKERGGGGSPY
jgi:hypothetical protein